MTEPQAGARPRLLAVFAHPDDESFGPGGTIARYAAQGDVTLVTATRGEASTVGRSLEYGPERLGAVRERELRSACAILGVRDMRLLGYQDDKLKDVDPEELTSRVEAIMREVQPSIVITFHPNGISGHPDHMAMTAATSRAFERVFGCDGSPGAARLYYWALPEEVAKTVRAEFDSGVRGVPTEEMSAAVDVSPFAQVKWQAILAHETQSHPFTKIVARRLELLLGTEHFVEACPEADRPRVVRDRLDG